MPDLRNLVLRPAKPGARSIQRMAVKARTANPIAANRVMGRFLKPLYRRDGVLRDAQAVSVQVPESGLPKGISLVRSEVIPLRRLGIVPRHAITDRIWSETWMLKPLINRSHALRLKKLLK